jgi:hypothetical protein
MLAWSHLLVEKARFLETILSAEGGGSWGVGTLVGQGGVFSRSILNTKQIAEQEEEKRCLSERLGSLHPCYL